MTNIPTELLRTLVAVVELRSFTKAAQSLCVTQPAVSAQIKRLQLLLGGELFDRSAPGVTLSGKGQMVVDFARRLLSINDQILKLAAPRYTGRPLRIGIPGDFGGVLLPAALAEFRRRPPHHHFYVHNAGSDRLLSELGQSEIDLAVSFTQGDPPPDARHRWTENVVWIRGPQTALDPTRPVPLVIPDDDCVLNRVTTQTLDQAGRAWEAVFTAASKTSIVAAVAAGLGVSAVAARFVPADVTVWSDAPLPPLPAIDCGIYLRHGLDRPTLEQLADVIADALRPSDVSPAAPAAIARTAGQT